MTDIDQTDAVDDLFRPYLPRVVTAWADEAKPYMPKGPTGVAVRTLAELAFAIKK